LCGAISGEGSSAFLKKSAQKTFGHWARGGFTSMVQIHQSFFCFFFVHKKEVLASPCL
jgi:hypothetical protein